MPARGRCCLTRSGRHSRAEGADAASWLFAVRLGHTDPPPTWRGGGGGWRAAAAALFEPPHVREAEAARLAKRERRNGFDGQGDGYRNDQGSGDGNGDDDGGPSSVQQSVFLLALASFLVGVGKGGIGGLAALAVALFSLASPPGTARRGMALLVPVLCVADVAAGCWYARHVRWRVLARLFAWTLPGMGAGLALGGAVSDRAVRLAVASLLLGVTALRVLGGRHWARGARGGGGAGAGGGEGGGGSGSGGALLPYDNGKALPAPMSPAGVACVGLVGGAITMVANIMGPLLDAYLLTLQLSKFEFVGTRAWFFILVNVVKVPLQLSAGNLDGETVKVGLRLGVLAIAGIGASRLLLRVISQRAFEAITWLCIVLSAGRMLLAT
jgi:uncharacterized membrane protein YfcA